MGSLTAVTRKHAWSFEAGAIVGSRLYFVEDYYGTLTIFALEAVSYTHLTLPTTERV
mgnify:CR=1 FL=1